jgi:hypothetical protein
MHLAIYEKGLESSIYRGHPDDDQDLLFKAFKEQVLIVLI